MWRLIEDFWDIVIQYKYQKKEAHLESRQEPLFHYTNALGLQGIIESNRLWATHIEFLNDSLELVYGKALVKDCVEQVLISATNDDERALIKEVIGNFNTNPIDKEYDVYVACFCENGDLLSQWRGYGAFGKGYAIGFDSTKLAPKYRKFPNCNIMIRSVIYRLEDQKAEVYNLINLAFEQLASVLDKINLNEKADMINGIAHALFFGLRNLTYLFKTPQFQEEREWRAIYLNGEKTEEKRQPIKFRTAKDAIIPYMEFDITPSAGVIKAHLPIIEIICGPGVEYVTAKKALSMLLIDKSMNGVSLEKSEISLR